MEKKRDPHGSCLPIFIAVLIVAMLFIIIALGYTGKITIDRDCEFISHDDPYPPLCTIDRTIGEPFSREHSHSYESNNFESVSHLMKSLPDAFSISDKLMKKPGDGNSIPHEYLSTLFWAFTVVTHQQLVSTINNNDEPIGSHPNGNEQIYRTYSRSDTQGVRQQINYQSPAIDGSFIYGSNSSQLSHYRSFSGGKLHLGHNVIGLGAHNVLRSLFILEHNFWADHLSSRHPTWDDEHLFQMARKIVCGIIQAITFNEYIPILLGSRLEKNCFNAEKQPSISNEFANGIFSFHYSLAPEILEIRDQRTSQIIGFMPLIDSEGENRSYFNSFGIDIGELLLGMRLQLCEDLDVYLSDSLRILRTPNGELFDLGAYEILKGRDHGLPTYNSLRSHFGNTRLTSWDDISENHAIKDSLIKAYGERGWKHVDLFVGVLSEPKYSDSVLGYVGYHVVRKQFQEIRDTYKYFYLFDGLLLEYKERIHSTTLGKVIARHTKIDYVKFLGGESVFVLPR